jgi:hypothetical protein
MKSLQAKDLGALMAGLGPAVVRLAAAETEAERAAAIAELGAAVAELPEDVREQVQAMVSEGPAAVEALGFAAGLQAARGTEPEMLAGLAAIDGALAELPADRRPVAGPLFGVPGVEFGDLVRPVLEEHRERAANAAQVLDLVGPAARALGAARTEPELIAALRALRASFQELPAEVDDWLTQQVRDADPAPEREPSRKPAMPLLPGADEDEANEADSTPEEDAAVLDMLEPGATEQQRAAGMAVLERLRKAGRGAWYCSMIGTVAVCFLTEPQGRPLVFHAQALRDLAELLRDAADLADEPAGELH